APAQGWRAGGTAVIHTPAGDRAGAVDVSVWGAHHCRVEIHFVGGEMLSLVSNGGQLSVRGGGPGAALAAEPGLHQGCDWLPPGLLWDDVAAGAALSEDLPPADTPRRVGLHRVPAGRSSPAATARLAQGSAVVFDLDAAGRPVRASYLDMRGREVVTTYSQYRDFGATALPTQVERRVAGALRLTADYTVLAPSVFTEEDFTLPPPPPGVGPHPFGGKGGGR
ncbi:MAG: hypothetical protein ACRD1L_07055, partial [Terriglobales bacterium]